MIDPNSPEALALNEADTRAELIEPTLRAAGWGEVEGSRIYREEIAKGRLKGAGGKRADGDIADIVLAYKGHKLAVVEAKRRSAPITAGLAQAKRYAQRLRARLALSTNGRGIYQADMHSGDEGDIDRYPTPDEAWRLAFGSGPTGETWRERFGAVPFADRGGQWRPRYYQHNAITAALEAIHRGEDRVLLTLATGTGKTGIATQIAWKLFGAKWNLHDWRRPENERTGRRPRVLFLADRNILANQAFNEFSAFDEDARVRIEPSRIRKQGRVPKNGSVFFTIFQTFLSGDQPDDDGEADDESIPPSPAERGFYFGEYPPDFFDVIFIDECHRGGANDESTWRGILEYFAPAVQIGLTATPRRDDNADTYNYFGKPAYIYSLKEGINDGYLTPFKVRQIQTTMDEYTPAPDDTVLSGQLEPGRVYKEEDFNRVIVIKEREAKRVGVYMGDTVQAEKAIAFCATQAHALLIRDLINQVKESSHADYCVRVTAEDGAAGDAFLRAFRNNEKTIPTVLTTSRKLSTGVDARNVRHIVLLRPVKSMIEFKQIIGRGTRLYEGKDYFTVWDFVKAHQHFSDPEWDGEPLAPEACKKCETYPCVCVPPDKPDEPPCKVCGKQPCECLGGAIACQECGQAPCVCEGLVIKLADGKARKIQHMTSTTFWSPDGRQMSAQEFLTALYGELPEFFTSEAELRTLWSDPDTRRRLLEGLKEKGFGEEQLTEMQRVIGAEQSDLFDVLTYVAYALEPLSRQERAARARVAVRDAYADRQQAFVEFVLGHYVTQGVAELDPKKLNELLKLRYNNSLPDAIAELGTPDAIRGVFVGFQQHLYTAAAPDK